MAIVLARPGHALDEEVAAREERDDEPLQEVVLADDDLLDLVEQALHGGGPVLSIDVVHALLPLLHECLVRRQAGGAAGDIDRHGQADADEHVLLGRVDQGGHDADHLPIAVDERPARVARVDRGIDLDEAGQGLAGLRRR